MAMEMDRYGIDVAALSETRLPGCNSLEDREPDKWTMRQMDCKPTGPQLNWTARQMDHKKNGQTDYWTGSVSSDFAVSNGVMMMMMTMTTTMTTRGTTKPPTKIPMLRAGHRANVSASSFLQFSFSFLFLLWEVKEVFLLLEVVNVLQNIKDCGKKPCCWEKANIKSEKWDMPLANQK